MLALIAAAAVAQPTLDEPHEAGPRGPHITPESVELAPPAPNTTGDFTSVQVNVIQGMNVLADAANEPSIAVDPTAPLRMAIGWRQFDTIDSNFRQAGWSRSTDAGRTWADKSVIEPGYFRSDPVLAADADGTFYYLSLHTGAGAYLCDLFVSHDAGRTWPFKRFAYGGDKAWLAADATGGIGDGHLYQAWNTAGNAYFPAQFSRAARGDLLWDPPIIFIYGKPAQPVAGTLDVAPDGTLYVSGFQHAQIFDKLSIVRSEDAQDPFMPVPTFALSTLQLNSGTFLPVNEPPNPGGINGQVDIAVNPADGSQVFVIVQTEGAFDDPNAQDVTLFRSLDAGRTWSDPIRVSDKLPAPIHRWFAAMDVSPTGRIDVVFNDNRDAPDDEPNLTRTYYTYSTDAGLTWSDDEPIGPQWDSHAGWPDQDKIGDYYDIVSDTLGAHLAYATTYNAEQDVYYARLGPRDCNANMTPDPDDIATGTSTDCNDNAIPDECEIAAETLEDSDNDGVPDICACPADLNADGTLDVLDFVTFQRLWQAQDPQADCDDDAAYTIADFVCYQQLYQAGCP